MSEYCKPLKKSFVCRTNKAIQEYAGQYDATVLLNCLLGLLVVPFERDNQCFRNTKKTGAIEDFFTRVQNNGYCNYYGKEYTPFDLIRFLRNSIAHFNVDTVSQDGQIIAFSFFAYEMNQFCEEIEADCRFKHVKKDDSPTIIFEVTLTLEEIKELANIIKTCVLEIKENKNCETCDYRG